MNYIDRKGEMMDKWLFNEAVMYRHIFTYPGTNEFDEAGYLSKLASLGVSGNEAHELLKKVDAAIAENISRRKFVVSYMHYTGENYGKLDNKQMWKVYCAADGYGWLRASALREINGGWDWSHIRDSTIDGWKRMEKKLKAMGF